MNWLRIVTRWLLLFSLLVGVPSLLMALSLGARAGWLCAGTLFAVGLVFALLLERFFMFFFDSNRADVYGLHRSLNRVWENRYPLHQPPLPRIGVIVEPRPLLFCVRGMFGPGLILISQGMLFRYTEAELRTRLEEACDRLSQRELFLQSSCAFLAQCLLSLAPKAWVQTYFMIWFSKGNVQLASRPDPRGLRVWQSFPFLVILPLAVFFLKLGKAEARDFDYSDRILNPDLLGSLVRPGLIHLLQTNPYSS